MMSNHLIDELEGVLGGKLHVGLDLHLVPASFNLCFKILIVVSLGHFFDHHESFSLNLGFKSRILDCNKVSRFILTLFQHLIFIVDMLVVEIIVLSMSVLVQLVQNVLKLRIMIT